MRLRASSWPEATAHSSPETSRCTGGGETRAKAGCCVEIKHVWFVASATPISKKRSRFHQHYGSAPGTPYGKGSNGVSLPASVEFFFKKVFRLAASRINELCSLFPGVSNEHIQQVWNVVYRVLRFEQDMLMNRHLDHFIMCAIYAICSKIHRVSQLCCAYHSEVYSDHGLCCANR